MKDSLLRSRDFQAAPTIVKGFIRTKIAIEGCSEKTAAEYLLDLRTFFRYLLAKERDIPTEGEEFESIDISKVDLSFVLGIDREAIVDFLTYAAAERGNEKPSRARKLSALKSFFRYVSTIDSRYADFDPAKNIKAPKKDKTLPKYLTEAESIALLQSILDDEDSRTRTRDFAMITLFLNCGMRLSELVGINLSDIDRELRSLRVFGKGAKERIVYLNDACRAALGEYLTTRASLTALPQDADALFLSNRQTRISNQMVQHVVYKYLDRAGLSQRGFSVHKLRHTAATLMYQSGAVDVRVLKDILGHAQLNTTQIYTHLSNRSMEEAMTKNPLATLAPRGDGARRAPEEKE
ncbi:MAG: tyrosine-type recombinase/integrase [Clostridia bacterium]|nr:tyrosine-type recombinase/integrase [Clostridia bacterium]